MNSIIFLFTTSLLAGIVNCVAGGGALIAFPALLISGSAYLARKLHLFWIRSFIIGVSLSMIDYFFIQQTNKI